MTTQTHDNLAFPQHNLLDGREYEEHLAFVYPDDLREGDVVTDGVGVYQISNVGNWDAVTSDYIRHIRIRHTIAGPIMGGLLRGRMERVHLLARRRTTEGSPE